MASDALGPNPIDVDSGGHVDALGRTAFARHFLDAILSVDAENGTVILWIAATAHRRLEPDPSSVVAAFRLLQGTAPLAADLVAPRNGRLLP